MCPWLHHLRGGIHIEYTYNPNASVILRPYAFEVLVLNLSTESVRRRLEAIDLLLLAAQLEPVNTWEQHIRIGCQAKNYDPSLIQPTEIVPRLRLVLNASQAAVEWLKWMNKPWLRSPKYWLTRKWLLNEYHIAWRYLEPPLQRIPMLIQLGHPSATMTTQICRLAARNEAKIARFQMIEIKFHDHRFTRYRLTNRKLLINRRLLELDSYQIDDIYESFTHAELSRLRDAGIHVRFSAQDIDGDASVHLRGDLANPIERFECKGSITALPDEWWLLLREAGSVKVVDLHIHHLHHSLQHTHRHLAVFLDPRSPTSVEHVYLRGPIDNESFREMLEVLRSGDPFEQLGWRQITASRYRPTTRSHLRSLSLELHASLNQDKSKLFELLRIIGFDLESLDIQFLFNWQCPLLLFDEDDLVKLFTACPKLQCLSLHNFSLASLRPIINGFNTGLCASLTSLISVGRVDDVASIASLFEACNDRHQRVRRTLRDVEVKYEGNFTEQVLVRILDAIRCNRTLRHIAFKLNHNRVEGERFQRELRQMRRTPVLVPSEKLPLSLSHKLAFLSAVRSLDQDSCHHVFQFACGMERRRIFC